MYFSTLSLSLALMALTTSSPLSPPQPITDAQLAQLSTLNRRDGDVPKTPQPITDAQLAALNALETRSTLEARDSRSNCAKNVLGDTTIGGNGVWVGVDDYLAQARRFCHEVTTTDVAINHEVSDTYPVFLTNQGDPKAQGPAGNIVCEFLLISTPLFGLSFAVPPFFRCESQFFFGAVIRLEIEGGRTRMAL